MPKQYIHHLPVPRGPRIYHPRQDRALDLPFLYMFLHLRYQGVHGVVSLHLLDWICQYSGAERLEVFIPLLQGLFRRGCIGAVRRG